MVTDVSSSRLKSCSTRCTPRWRIVHAAVAQAPGATGRPSDRRAWVFKSETGAVEHLFQIDGGALPSAFHHHHNESCLRRVAEFSGQPADGGSAAEPSAALLSHGAHQR